MKPTGPQQARPPRGPAGPVAGDSPIPPSTDKDAKAEAGKSDKSASQKPSNRATPVAATEQKELKKGGKGATNGDKDAELADSSKPGFQTPKRFSLYLKGLPTPTSEAEIRTYFGDDADKVSTHIWPGLTYRSLPSSLYSKRRTLLVATAPGARRTLRMWTLQPSRTCRRH